VTLQNPSGKTKCTISLEVQKHTQPAAREYDRACGADATLHKVFKVGEKLIIMPINVDIQTN
jgi:hypothetical protein